MTTARSETAVEVAVRVEKLCAQPLKPDGTEWGSRINEVAAIIAQALATARREAWQEAAKALQPIIDKCQQNLTYSGFVEADMRERAKLETLREARAGEGKS